MDAQCLPGSHEVLKLRRELCRRTDTALSIALEAARNQVDESGIDMPYEARDEGDFPFSKLRLLLRIGQENPLAETMRMTVKEIVHCLEAEVGHAGAVGMRIGETNVQGVSPNFFVIAFFPGQYRPVFFPQCPGQRCNLRLICLFSQVSRDFQIRAFLCIYNGTPGRTGRINKLPLPDVSRR